MVGCCMTVAVACAILYVVGYYVTVTVVPRSHMRLGVLSQIGCCRQDTAAVAIETPPKSPEAKSRGLVELFFALQFPEGGTE